MAGFLGVAANKYGVGVSTNSLLPISP